MKKFKQLLIASLLVLAVPLANAQPQLTDEQIAQLEQRIAATQARLNLSEEQRAQVRPILEASAEARRDVLEKHGLQLDAARSGTPGRMGLRQLRALRADMQAVREESRNALATILSDEQLAEWEVIQEEQRAEFRKRIQTRRG